MLVFPPVAEIRVTVFMIASPALSDYSHVEAKGWLLTN